MYTQRAPTFGFCLLIALAVAMPNLAWAAPKISGPGGSTPPPSPPDAVVLFDQYNNAAANSISSQNFEAANDAFDSFLADDFVIGQPDCWCIDGVEVQGVYFNGPGPMRSVNVYFYANTNCNGVTSIPGSGEPGECGPGPLCTYLNVPVTDNGGSLVIDLLDTPGSPFPCTLCPGTGTARYWMVVQANMDFTPNGQWGWTERLIQGGLDSAAWRNPGGGFGVCPTWNRKTVCIPTASGPDQVFRLTGFLGPPCAATPVEQTTWGSIKAIYD